MRRLAVLVTGLVVLAGCSAPVPAPTRTATVPANAALASARVAAGIPDCPDADPAATPVTGGLPATTLSCLGGERTLNLAGLRGRPTVVNLWAQWCPPCRQEAPYLREASASLGDRVLVLGVDYDDPRPDWAIEFASLVGWTHPHVVDPSRSVAGPLQVQGIPLTLFVDAQGRIVHRHAGPFTSTGQLEELVETYLGVAA